MSLGQLKVVDFVEELSSSSPAPGGGSVAALAASMGAALTAMVCRLTIGKKKYADVESEISEVLSKTSALQAQLLQLMDRDTEAFNKVMDAFGLPKENDEQKSRRQEAIEKATIDATLVPLEVMHVAAKCIELAGVVAEKGNANARSDAGVSALMALTGAEGAYYNVLINLSSLKTEDFVQNTRKEADALVANVEQKALSVKTRIRQAIGA